MVINSLLLYKKYPPPPRNLILILCIAFLLGISVDPLILPSLLSLALFIAVILFKIIFQTQKQRKIILEKNKYFFSIFIVFVFACLIYYFANPIGLTNDHTPDYGFVTFKQYLAANFNNFVQDYCRFFFKDNSAFLVIIMFLILIIFTLNYYEKQKIIRILHIIIFNIISFLLFFFSTFTIGFCYAPQSYWATFPKWTNLYLYSCCFFTLMLTGFVIDENIKLQKYSAKIKTALVLSILILFHKPLVLKYPYHIKMFEEQQKRTRCFFYNAEKFAVSQNSAEIYLPKSFQKEYLSDSGQEYWFLVYINAIYTYKNKKEHIVFLQDDKMNFLDSEKTTNIKFKTLLEERRKRINKKFFMDNDYNE